MMIFSSTFLCTSPYLSLLVNIVDVGKAMFRTGIRLYKTLLARAVSVNRMANNPPIVWATWPPARPSDQWMLDGGGWMGQLFFVFSFL